jgi:hypothetical protein
LPGFVNVGAEIGFQSGELFAEAFHLVLLGRGKGQTGAAVVAHGFGEQFGVLAGQIWLGVGAGLDGLEDIAAVIEADEPLVQQFGLVLGGVAEGGVGAGLADNFEAVCGKAGPVGGVVESADRAGKIDLGGGQFADLVQGLIAQGDG